MLGDRLSDNNRVCIMLRSRRSGSGAGFPGGVSFLRARRAGGLLR